MSNDRRKINAGSLISGLIILGLGIGFLLDNLNVIDFGKFLSLYWPSLLIIIALYQLVTRSANIFWSFILLVAGIIFQVNTLYDLPINFWGIFWPAMLILFGMQLIFSKIVMPRPKASTDSEINAFVGFGGQDIRNAAKTFEGGELTALFGGIKADLRDTEISGEIANLKVTAMFGGIELTVPRNWKVEVTGLPLFGGWDNKTRPEGDNIKTLKVNASVMFGGFEVKN
jgi:predicted membrane protein